MRQGIFLMKWFDNGIFTRKWMYSFGERKVDDSGDGGGRRESIHDFRSFVSTRSREHVELEKKRLILWISMMVVGGKSERRERAVEGGGLKF